MCEIHKKHVRITNWLPVHNEVFPDFCNEKQRTQTPFQLKEKGSGVILDKELQQDHLT